MSEELIRKYNDMKQLRKKTIEKSVILSLLNSVKTNSEVILTIPLSEKSATLVFRELYESVRQLGDAKWWLLGYEPKNHDVSLEILKKMDIKDKHKLNNLDRFKNIRHDINYRGFRASIEQANELIAFWNSCGKEILDVLMKI